MSDIQLWRGQIQSPGKSPNNADMYIRRVVEPNNDEKNAGIQAVNGDYLAGDVRRYITDESDLTDAINKAVDSRSKVRFPKMDYPTTDTIVLSRDDLDVCFEDGAVIKPDPSVLNAVQVGSTGNPARMNIDGLRVDRTTYSGATENVGVLWLETTQCTFVDIESRWSKYNHKWLPTTTGFDYNLLMNLQGIGGFYNFWLDASANGYVNENDFVGGRGFCTANTDTNLRINAGGLGTGHNRFSMSLEGQGVQAIYDNGNANQFHQCRTEGVWTNPKGAGHVYGPNCIYANVITSRNDYTMDRSASLDPRDQVMTYRAGSFFNTANNGLTTATFRNQSASRGSVIDMESTRDNDDAYGWRSIRRIASESGTHTGSSGASTLTDSTLSMTTDEYVGAIIENETDGSKGVITANAATTVSATLINGQENDWDPGDDYSIYLLNGSLKTNGAMQVRRRLQIDQSGWNFEPFQMGNHYFWMNGNDFRGSIGAPSSATDGALIATLT